MVGEKTKEVCKSFIEYLDKIENYKTSEEDIKNIKVFIDSLKSLKTKEYIGVPEKEAIKSIEVLSKSGIYNEQVLLFYKSKLEFIRGGVKT